MAAVEGGSSATTGAERGSRFRFVNHLRFTLSLSEIRFELSLLGSTQPVLPVWRFATTPDHLLTMHRGFTAAVETYQGRYGRIHAVQVDPAMIRFRDGPGDG